MTDSGPGREELLKQNEALRRHLTHELNNILAAALVNTDLLRRRLAPGSPLLEIVDDLSHSLDQATALIQEVKVSNPKLGGAS